MQNNNQFYSNITPTEKNKFFISKIQEYSQNNTNTQIYLINTPLGNDDKYKYSYQENVIVILSPKHKIIFLDIGDDDKKFLEYCDDFIEDLGFISDKYDYREHIGRPKEWKDKFLAKETTTKKGVLNNFFGRSDDFDVERILNKNNLSKDLYRIGELLISLLVGSINDLDRISGANEPGTLLDKVKNKIVLFDGDQTRFIYEEKRQKLISIQGLAGTGKTELLLHKLKELYTKSDSSKIFFTCKNITLSRDLNKRIPEFFNFMKVDKQIEYNKRLWVSNAWGSFNDVNSGLYRYVCHFYGIPFFNFGQIPNFNTVLRHAINEIKKIGSENFQYAFDYILIDESQDFPDSLFELCKIITKEQVYVAGDLFQDIFSEQINNREINPDYILNKCYRTDPRTLMFSQSIGMGLFEKTHLNWLEDDEWNKIGYNISRNGQIVSLSREPIRRFDDLDIDNYESMKILSIGINYADEATIVINQIIEDNPTITPDDIGVVFLDDYNSLCDFSAKLEFLLQSKLSWQINKAYETKQKINNQVFVTNKNNVKGLEFPFLICVTKQIRGDYEYRNTLYTMLTRSFLQSYLLVHIQEGVDEQRNGLETINKEKRIRTIQPTQQELENIKERIRIKGKENKDISYRDFILQVLRDIGIEIDKIDDALRLLNASKYENSFDEDSVKVFLIANKNFF